MKNLAFILLAAGALLFSACNSATKQKGGNGADSGATGSSGASAGSAAGNSNATTDTSTTGKSATNPTVDSGKTKPQK